MTLKTQFLHYMITNIPCGAFTRGDIILPWRGPTPLFGTHRYVFLLFKQPHGAIEVAPPLRAGFSARAFAAVHDLGNPITAVFFKSSV